MIYYFSGTGNTWLSARYLNKELNQQIVPITEIDATEAVFPDNDVIFMFPIYAWGVPPVMMKFIERVPEREIEKIRGGEVRCWVIATCGDETGLAVDMIKEQLKKRGVEPKGSWSVIAPNVYVLLPGFNVDSKEVEEDKLHKMKGRMKEIGNAIKSFRPDDSPIEDVFRGPFPRMKTRLVYPLFRRWGVNYRKWKWSKECIGCGKCSAVCPERNITMVGGHPQWGSNCDSCLACYHICPTHAVEYGKVTTGKGQYKYALKRKENHYLSESE